MEEQVPVSVSGARGCWRARQRENHKRHGGRVAVVHSLQHKQHASRVATARCRAPVARPPRRSIFCCLAPSQSEQYVRQAEGPVVLRPLPPQPPGWTEAVLGPQLAQDAGKKTLVLDLGARLAAGLA